MNTQTTHEIPYPFMVSTYTEMDEDGGWQVPCWNPANRNTMHRTYSQAYGEEQYMVDGIGAMLITEVCRVQPGSPWQERVFFTRRWRDPDGKVFGKNTLHMATVAKFSRMLRGYAFPYIVCPDKVEV